MRNGGRGEEDQAGGVRQSGQDREDEAGRRVTTVALRMRSYDLVVFVFFVAL